jgi:hypothetical protein
MLRRQKIVERLAIDWTFEKRWNRADRIHPR